MNVLYILAHPDDAEIWCGGTILQQIKKNYNVKVLYLYSTNDRKKEALTLSSDRIKVEFVKPSIKKLRKKIKEFTPNIIVTHWYRDCHHQHKDCFTKIYNILPELLVFDNLKFSFYVCDTYNSVGFDNSRFEPNKYVDITNFYNSKLNLINNHKSQPNDYFIKMIEKQNKHWGTLCGCKLAESYLQLPVQGNYYDNEL